MEKANGMVRGLKDLLEFGKLRQWVGGTPDAKAGDCRGGRARKWVGTFAVALALALATPSVSYSLPARGVTPVNNREYISVVRELVRNAQQNLYLMLYQARYYEEYPDTETNHLLRELIEAKLRGVDVKIVIDTGDWNPSNKNEYNLDFVDRMTTAGIEVWEDSTTEVSHEKVMLVDDNITVVSSHNWTYYSIAKNNEVAVVVDSKPLNHFFREYFRQRCQDGRPRHNVGEHSLESLAKPSPELAPSKVRLRTYPVVDVEPIPNRLFFPAVHTAFLNAKQSITVVQRSLNMPDRPRLKPGESALPGQPASEVNVLVEDLISAHKRGLKVRVVLDQTEGFTDSANDAAAQYLRENGVEVLREDLATQTHAKLVVIDDDKVVVGSTNWTQPALEDGNEASVLITSREVNKVYQDYVHALLQNAAPYQTVKRDIWAPTTAPNQRK
ncbi:MAG: phospholipase D-like domain-containing protein [Candidatus Sumerlaea chitinivorans]|uniref:phospholipase D n=1 Tax=Sumerlaea chitinivorans TaxID=2250252 RepID=A0A2Z4Y7K2_SUMC1|nr:Phospholipase D/Transphosphatidylase [Candidatus Sumerlaea chitinivorans]MCX7963598.1 phospholipase D-like domain-containing protein [Candidatus Sumerlaea chitinivorans]